MNRLAQTIHDAYQTVVDSSIPNEMHHIAFQWILENTSQQAPSQTCSKSSKAANEPSTTSLAKTLNIGVEQLDDMFDITEDSVMLTISSKQLPKNKSQATKMIALLIGVANEELFKKQTSYDEIRRAADYLGCLDQSNFSKQMKQLDSLIKIKGSGRKAEFTLKQPGREEAATIAQELQDK